MESIISYKIGGEKKRNFADDDSLMTKMRGVFQMQRRWPHYLLREMIKISNEEGERAGDSSLKSCKYWKLQVNNPWAAKIVSSFGQEQEKKILVVMNWLLGKITLIAFGYSPTWSWACFIVCSREEADLAYGIFRKKEATLRIWISEQDWISEQGVLNLNFK